MGATGRRFLSDAPVQHMIAFALPFNNRATCIRLASLRTLIPAVLALASLSAGACVPASAQRHRLDPRLLQAVMQVDASAQRLNDSVLRADGQYQPSARPCARTEAAAAAMARLSAQQGLNWPTLGSLFSSTRYFSYRAQALLFNQLAAAGAIQGQPMQVPSLRPSESPWAPGVDELDIQVFVYSDVEP